MPVRALVVDRAVAATGDTGVSASTLTASRAPDGFSVALRAAPGPGPVVLSRTPTADIDAGGYEGHRSDIPGVVAGLPNRATSGCSDAALGTADATYYRRSYAGTWRSAHTSATVPAC